MKNTIRLAALAVATMTGIGLAQAETRIENIYGPVSLNQGEGFTPVLGAISVNPGDRIMADKGGSATVVYSDACKVPVKPGAIVIVMSRAPCLETASNLEQGSARALDGDTPDWVIPAAAGAGIIGGGVALFLVLDDNKDDDNGVSP